MKSNSENFLTLTLLISLTASSQLVHSKVITIDTTDGRDSTKCCDDGRDCTCSSLSTALHYMTNNTVINITSESVTLEGNIEMGSDDLNNITITGNGATIMCNNSGGVHCDSCDNVVIEGITWDKCGDPNGTDTIAGVAFLIARNISLLNCTFQYSQTRAVLMLGVSENVLIYKTRFLYNSKTIPSNNTCGGLSISASDINKHVNVTICESYFIGNGYFCNFDLDTPGGLHIFTYSASLSIDVVRTQFFSNNGAAAFVVTSEGSQLINLIEISVCDNTAVGTLHVAGISCMVNNGMQRIELSSSLFCNNAGSALWLSPSGNYSSIIISNSNFTNNTPYNTSIDDQTSVDTLKIVSLLSQIVLTLVDVRIVNCSITAHYGGGGIVFITVNGNYAQVNLTRVSVQANNYPGDRGVVYVYIMQGVLHLLISECQFVNNSSPSIGATLYIDSQLVREFNMAISSSVFHENYAGDSIVYVHEPSNQVREINSNIIISNSMFHENHADDSIVFVQELSNLTVISSVFMSNIGSSIHLYSSILSLGGTVSFDNNTASNGAALYLDQGSTVTIVSGATLYFTNNSAIQHGGAMYVSLPYDCPELSIFQLENSSAIFTNNSAEISGSSIFFSIPKLCQVDINISSPESILNIPCQFNYSNYSDGNIAYHNCTYMNGSESPIVTSPHELRLYFPHGDGFNISSDIYYMMNNILGYDVTFAGAMFDYYGNPAEPTQFSVECIECAGTIKPNLEHVLIDNSSFIRIKFSGQKITDNGLNATLFLKSAFLTLKQISTTLIVRLLPCFKYPGNIYSEKADMCVCYHQNVQCYDTYNEIKRGYWFGSVGGTSTTSLCPSHYCNFVDRTETRQGYFELPTTVDGQCNDHRTGSACGECNSPGYTLAYDSTDCISVDHCSAGMIVLVVVLTCLYWVVVVVGVFSLMYFNFQISSGYVYGIIYYYSIVGALLDNNPYVSNGMIQFVSVLSSFAQLSPRFLGKLCFIKGLSGIDQLFIHYSHAVAVSLLTLLIVLAARCSVRITVFVSRCIIRVICLVLLLSYTSLASTSLQLLGPLRFTDVDQVYTYASPGIKYFHDRHVIYGIVAVICEMVVGIGLPLLLLLEPLLSRKINFIKIKPLLDQFQGCYKDKYRWFAAYYLICRQVIMLIIFVGNRDYYTMLFYLQTGLIVIAMIHMWFQPYRDELLNALDGLILLLMVLVVNINTFPFLHHVTTEISLVLVVLPLFLLCCVVISKIVHICIAKKKSYRHYLLIDGNDNGVADDVVNQNVDPINEGLEHQNYNTFQEPLLELAYASN